MNEEWRPIPGYEGLYEVSDQGRVRSLRAGRIMRAQVNPLGYSSVELSRSAIRARRYVHVWEMLAFVGPRPIGQHVRHLDGNAANNNLSNLAYGSLSENEHDKLRHGTHYWANKTHCPQGHAYSGDNTIVNKRGSRECRECHLARGRDRYAREGAASWNCPAHGPKSPRSNGIPYCPTCQRERRRGVPKGKPIRSAPAEDWAAAR